MTEPKMETKDCPEVSGCSIDGSSLQDEKQMVSLEADMNSSYTETSAASPASDASEKVLKESNMDTSLSLCASAGQCEGMTNNPETANTYQTALSEKVQPKGTLSVSSGSIANTNKGTLENNERPGLTDEPDQNKACDDKKVQERELTESQPVNIPRLGQSPTVILPGDINEEASSLNDEAFDDKDNTAEKEGKDDCGSPDQPLEIKTEAEGTIDFCLSSTTSENTESSCSFGESMISRDSALSNIKDSNPTEGSEIGVSKSEVDAVPTSEVKQEYHEEPSKGDETKKPGEENSKIEYTASQIPVEYDEPEFMWDEYLEETGATPAQPTSFKHVESSLQSGFDKGMKLEVANKSPEGTYWVASIVMSCGQLLRLRWDGIGENTSADFWSDTCSSDIHPLGWCKENNKPLKPPEEFSKATGEPEAALEKILCGAKSTPSYLLDGSTGPSPIDQIKQGMRIEVHHELNPHCVWLCKIIENVGGRLLLRPEGAETATHDFWMFYTDFRLHPMGWSQEHGYDYKPFTFTVDEGKSEDDWKEVLENSQKDSANLPLPSDIFKDQVEVLEHEFKPGWKVEVLHPRHRSIFSLGTITKCIDKNFFIVEIEDCSPEAEKSHVQMCCHGGSQTVFPMHWCTSKGLRLTPPIGWHKRDFDWQEYLLQTGAEAAPEDAFNNQMVFDTGFSRGMKLEAVNPAQPWQICAATITRMVDNLMWLHLDNSPKMVSNHIVDTESHEIYPVGWCDSNNYTLKPPRRSHVKKKVTVSTQPEKSDNANSAPNKAYTQLKNGNGGSWCPKIYFNHRCFSGPFLSKGRIAELPKCVGPGPVTLVMKEVLSMLINVAYKSSRVLRELQLEGQPNPNLHQQILKAKYKGKSYQALVEISKTSDQIDEFCRQVCIKLECCPNLFSPMFVNGNCPENCHQLTKTKYTYYYGKTKKKRKIGRPPGGHSNLEHGPKKPGKRRKKKKINLAHRKKSNSADSDEELGDNGDDMDLCDGDSNSTGSLDRREMDDPDFRPAPGESWASVRGRKRKYQRHLPPPSEIKTRGAKLPKYSFERKTHQKVLITSPKHVPSQKMKTSQSSAFRPVKPEPMLTLDTNPLHWNVTSVVDFIKTTDCTNLARLFIEQEIDGQALLLLTLPTVQEYMELKLGPAIKLCHHIERVKIAFYEQYAD